MAYYYGFDWTYLVLVLPCMILAMVASSNVNATFKKYAKQRSYRGLTGAEAAQRVLRHNGVTNVRIGPCCSTFSTRIVNTEVFIIIYTGNFCAFQQGIIKRKIDAQAGCGGVCVTDHNSDSITDIGC